MAKSVMISIRPEWAEMIVKRKKMVEVRKNRPKIEVPFKCYIYCTKGKSKDNWGEVYGGYVIGEFVCDNIRSFDVPYPAFQKEMDKSILEQSCLTYNQLHCYACHDKLYGWHISDLKVYDKPNELSDFFQCHKCEWHEECREHEYSCDGTYKLKRPPQSWCYVEEL